jgi:hypothetical protein
MNICIYPVGGNAYESPRFGRGDDWATHTHATIDGKLACRISGNYLCFDASIEDQSGLPTCPVCQRKVIKARKEAL